MVIVIKVKYEEVLRRFTILDQPTQQDQSFTHFENKIRELFDIPVEKQFRVTYTDRDNDVITMGEGQDLMDALIMQSLNPLRVHVTLIEPEAIVLTAPFASASEKLPEVLKEAASNAFELVFKGLNDEYVKNRAYDPLPQLNDTVEQIVKRVTAQVQKALKCMEVKPGDTEEPIVKAVTTKVEKAVRDVEVKSRSSDEGWSRNRRGLQGRLPPPRPSEASPRADKSESNAAGELRSLSNVFRNGVQGDWRGVRPVAGTRFESSRKHDYKLCSNCFKGADDQADYTRGQRLFYKPMV